MKKPEIIRTVAKRSVVLASVLVIASTAHANTILVSDNFEGDTPGGALTGWTVVQPSPTTILAASGTSTGGSGANAVVATLTDNFSGTRYWSFSSTFALQTDKILEVSYKIRGNTVGDVPTFFARGSFLNGVTIADYLGIQNNGNGFRFYYNSQFNSTGLSNIINGNWYQFTETIDLLNKTITFTIDNLDSSAPGQYASGSAQFYNNTVNSVDRYGFYMVGNGGSFSIDDFAVQVVPEPSVTACLMLGGLFLLRLRKRIRVG